MGLTGARLGYRVHRDGSDWFCYCSPFSSLLSRSSCHLPTSFLSILLPLSCLPSVFSFPSLSHAVSEQTVLSRSISGCHAVEEKNKIKNRERERKRDISPRLKDLGNLNRFYSTKKMILSRKDSLSPRQ